MWCVDFAYRFCRSKSNCFSLHDVCTQRGPGPRKSAALATTTNFTKQTMMRGKKIFLFFSFWESHWIDIYMYISIFVRLEMMETLYIYIFWWGVGGDFPVGGGGGAGMGKEGDFFYIFFRFANKGVWVGLQFNLRWGRMKVYYIIYNLYPSDSKDTNKDFFFFFFF